MPTFVLLTKIASGSARQQHQLADMYQDFDRKLTECCPEAKRVVSYVLLGPYDFMHIFEAPDAVIAAKVALLAGYFGFEATQTLTAIPLDELSRAMDR